MFSHKIPKDHPRYESLMTREKIIQGLHKKVVAEAGLIAHGRGEAFDYIIGEKTPSFALLQEELGVITLLLAKRPVISVNGNVAALCPHQIIEFSKNLSAPLEINLFYRSTKREAAIKKALEDAGAESLLGTDPEYQETISEISHQRRIVDSRGIGASDCVFVPLEDGDRTSALRKMEKAVVTVDLNPLSRTSLTASVSITNNIIRAIPDMIQMLETWKGKPIQELELRNQSLNNQNLLKEALRYMSSRLIEISNKKNGLI